MLRSFLIYLSKAGWARKLLSGWSVAWRVASRFIAGETLTEGLATVKALNAKGINATLDHLGEHTTTPDEARRATEEIVQIFGAIEQAKVKANVSIKLTQIGLALGKELCAENLKRILAEARSCGSFVRIDMEDTPWTDATLDIYREMRRQGFDNTGVVIQAYLYRSEKDIQELGQIQTPVRLCKGAYKEPANLAFPKIEDVNRNYDKLADLLMDISLANGAPQAAESGKLPPIPAIASHDPLRIEHAKAYAAKVGLPKGAIEFQMLNGIRRDLQEQLAADGYPVRVYVPFGREWYPYFMRRLAERPANVWFFLSNFFRK